MQRAEQFIVMRRRPVEVTSLELNLFLFFSCLFLI